MNLPERAQALLERWFGPPGDPDRERHRKIWFRSTPEFDDELCRDFLADHEAAAAGWLQSWEAEAESALAHVLLLDQIPRNIFRGSPRAYASDALARAAAGRAIEKGFDKELPRVWRGFFYLPFEHSEAIADQARGLALFLSLPADPGRPDTMKHARRHYEIIARFGRFPHRNRILGRASTPSELAFLEEPDSSF